MIGTETAVVGVTFDLGEEEDPFLTSLIDDLPDNPVHGDEPVKGVDLSTLQAHVNSQEAFTYSGCKSSLPSAMLSSLLFFPILIRCTALTTPPCTEGVSWFLPLDPLSISEEQLEVFKEILEPSARCTTNEFSENGWANNVQLNCQPWEWHGMDFTAGSEVSNVSSDAY